MKRNRFLYLIAPLMVLRVVANDSVALAQMPVRETLPITSARPLLHPLFSNGAVLQRNKPLPVWGWKTPRSCVSVQLAGKPA